LISGTPEQVSEHAASHTGRYLQPLLRKAVSSVGDKAS
jgi:excinuclease UvrABC ATPase subunit